MAWAITDDIIGVTPITQVDTVQRHPEGMIVHAVESVSQGGGEFLYLKGVVGTVAGSLVCYDQINHTTTLGAPAAANSGAPLVVAMAATIANSWGWYATMGAVTVQKDGTGLTAGGSVGLGTAAGQVGALTAGKQILGARVVNTVAGGVSTAIISLNRPIAQGAIT